MDELEIQKMLEEHEKRILQLEKLSNNKNKKVNTQSNSVYDLIEQLKADGFFDSPKLLKEIVDELARLGHHYKSTSLTNPIQRMLKNRSIGRIGKKGKWQYVQR